MVRHEGRISLRLVVASLMAVIALGAVACASGGAEVVGQAPQQPAAASAPAPAAPAADPLAPAAAAPTTQTMPSEPAMGDAMMDKPKYGGTLNYFMRGELRGGFNPHYPGGRRETRTAMGFAYENLGTWDNLEGQSCTYNLTPWVAESWEWTDETTLVVTIPQGIKFHNRPPVNGRELKARDVVFSFAQHREGGLQPLYWDNVVSMDATDDYTVTFKLTNPSPLFVSQLISDYRAPLLTQEAGGPEGDYTSAESVIGTGPWQLTKSTPGVGVTFERHSDYRIEGRPYIDNVNLSIMRDPTTRVAAIEVGKLDALDELSIGLKERMQRTSPDIQWVDCPGTLTQGITMNNQEPPFTDVRVRRAVSMAIDRESITKGLLGGFGVSVGVAPPADPNALRIEDFPPEARQYLEYNPEGARALLAEAGFSDGISLDLPARSYGSPFNELRDIVPTLLKRVGIDASLRIVSPAEYSSMLSNRSYGPIMITRLSSKAPLAADLFAYHSQQAPSSNRANVNDPNMDKILNELAKTLDPVKQAQLIKEAQISLVTNANRIWLPFPVDPVAYQPWFKGPKKYNWHLWIHASSLRFRDVWLDK